MKYKMSESDKKCCTKCKNCEKKDDNEEILDLIKERLELGKERYGHGVIVNDDTTKYGTENNDWQSMAMEEMLDGMVYIAASMIRYKRRLNKA